MTPQSSFMVLAAITPEREAELRELLDSMNDAPGRVNPNNALIAFAEFSMIHVARLLILKDNSLDDVKVYGLPRRDYPLYLAFLGNIDGERDAFYEELARRAPNGLRAIFSCCDGFTSETRSGRMDEKTQPLFRRRLHKLGRAHRHSRPRGSHFA